MPRRILIVDDDPEIRSLFARWLPQPEYRLAFCRKPLLAPAVAYRFRASLAIVDAHLGASVNGFQLCAILKQMRETRSIPVVMTSGRTVMDRFVDNCQTLDGLMRTSNHPK